MSEPPQKRRRTLLDHLGNEIDQLETENSHLKDEMDRMRSDMAELKLVDALGSKEHSKGTTQKKRLEKRIKDKTKDLKERDSTIEDIWNEIATLKAQVRLPEEGVSEEVVELQDQVEELHDLVGELRGNIAGLKAPSDKEAEEIVQLRNEIKTLTWRNAALTTIIKQAQELGQEVSNAVPSSPASDATCTLPEHSNLTAKMRLWEERLTSLSPPVLGNLLHRIYSRAFEGQLGIGEVRGMITQTHQLYNQKVSTFDRLEEYCGR